MGEYQKRLPPRSFEIALGLTVSDSSFEIDALCRRQGPVVHA